MCGIAALVSERSAPPPRTEDIGGMTALLRHRGPDGTGSRVDGAVALGHTRLSIVDIEGGAQPMANEDDSVRVVFNGEIFNHVELRAELERDGHRFRSRTDTEVLVHLYERDGDAMVDRLNGQFAFVLHDVHRHRVLVARDRVGIRPVYWCRVRDRIAIASEIKALFALPWLERRFDTAALPEIFGFWTTLGERTAFEHVRELPPGHVMRIELGAVGEAAAVSTRRYWQWSHDEVEPGDVSRDEGEACEALRALLEDAVRLQLRADVPVGAYLSGGLDSSGIVAMAARAPIADLRTYSLAFADAEFDESPHQRMLAGRFGTVHSELRIDRADVARAFARAVLHAETPIVRTAPVPMMLLAEHVNALGAKVVLTGEGADEVFGGYDLFKEARLRRFIAASSAPGARAALAGRLYGYLARSPVKGGPLAGHFLMTGLDRLDRAEFAHDTRLRSAGRTLQLLDPGVQASLSGWDAADALAPLLPEGFARWPGLHRDQFVEATTLLRGYILSSQGDRMAMAHSVEARHPYLDHRVIEFANRLPPRMKLRGLREKRILKAALAPLLPASTVERVKQPYRAPEAACFFVDGRLRDWCADLLSPGSIRVTGLFEPAAVDRLVAKFAAGRAIGAPDNMALVGVLSTLVLQRSMIDRPHSEAVS